MSNICRAIMSMQMSSLPCQWQLVQCVYVNIQHLNLLSHKQTLQNHSKSYFFPPCNPLFALLSSHSIPDGKAKMRVHEKAKVHDEAQLAWWHVPGACCASLALLFMPIQKKHLMWFHLDSVQNTTSWTEHRLI